MTLPLPMTVQELPLPPAFRLPNPVAEAVAFLRTQQIAGDLIELLDAVEFGKTTPGAQMHVVKLADARRREIDLQPKGETKP